MFIMYMYTGRLHIIHIHVHVCLRYLCFQEAQSYADENSLLFMETSAKTAMNVNDIFLAIGEPH